MGMKKKKNKNKNNSGNKAITVGGVLIIALIAFYNGIGYIGNALTDTAHALLWWMISLLVGATVLITELVRWVK